jgi:hypothetical protein
VPETPTTEGSIVAYLRLDASDWNAKLDEAEAKARELGRVDPTIRVNADTAEALAKLEELKALEAGAGGTVTTTTVSKSVSTSSGSSVASDAAAKVDAVAAAEKRYAAAVDASQIAAQRADLAAMRLDDTQTKRGRTDYQVATAELALEVAQKRETAAADKAIVSQRELNAALEASSRAAIADAAAQDTQSKATDKAAASNGVNVSRMGLIVAGVAALIPLAAPLTGFALGGAGALTAMGVAGVVALKGIGAEMAADTDLGNRYQDSLATVKNDLHQLEATAAAGVITPFNKALDYLQPQMPRINQDMGQMAASAGQIAGTSLTAIVSGFEAMEPLLVSGEQMLQGWANNMVLFARSPEFHQFIQYAVAELPQVNGLLINLGGVVIHLVEAFTPVGNVVIPILSAVAWGINAIPTPALTALAVGATAVGVAFLAWNYAVEPLLSKMGLLAGESATAATAQAAVAVAADAAAVAEGGAAAATTAWGAAIDFATGPVGLIIGLAAALGGAMLATATSTQAAAAATTDYGSALAADNGVIAENTKQAAAKALQDSGALKLAQQLGISLPTVTDAVIGQQGAYKSLTAQLEQQVTAGTHVLATGKVVVNQQTDQAKAAQKLLDIIRGQNGGLGDQVAAYKNQTAAMGKAGDAAQALAQDQNILDDASKSADSATQGYITALEAWSKSGQTAADTGTFLGATLVSMQGDWLSYDSALANASYANYTLTQTFQDQGKQVSQGVKYIRDTEKAAIDLNTGLIDVSKSGAPALLSQLSAMQSAAQKAAAATYQHEQATKGAGQAAADAATIFKTDTYDALVKDANQLGITADQAKKLADRYFGLPSDVITQLQTQGQSTVVQTLDGIGQQLAEISGHPWTSTLDANGVPLSHEAYLAQLRLDQIKQLTPTEIAADAATANMTVEQFKTHLLNIPDKTVKVTADTAAAEAAIARLVANAQNVANQYAAGNVYTTGKADGGTIYRATGGDVAAYLATGGMPSFQPRGTDTVAAMLTPGEFVVKQSSAGYDPQFMKAYNADPAAALNAIKRAGGDKSVVNHFYIYQADNPDAVAQRIVHILEPGA